MRDQARLLRTDHGQQADEVGLLCQEVVVVAPQLELAEPVQGRRQAHRVEVPPAAGEHVQNLLQRAMNVWISAGGECSLKT